MLGLSSSLLSIILAVFLLTISCNIYHIIACGSSYDADFPSPESLWLTHDGAKFSSAMIMLTNGSSALYSLHMPICNIAAGEVLSFSSSFTFSRYACEEGTLGFVIVEENRPERLASARKTLSIELSYKPDQNCKGDNNYKMSGEEEYQEVIREFLNGTLQQYDPACPLPDFSFDYGLPSCPSPRPDLMREHTIWLNYSATTSSTLLLVITTVQCPTGLEQRQPRNCTIISQENYLSAVLLEKTESLYVGFMASNQAGAAFNITKWKFSMKASISGGAHAIGRPSIGPSSNDSPHKNSAVVLYWVLGTLLLVLAMVVGLAVVFLICTKKRSSRPYLGQARPNVNTASLSQTPHRARRLQESPVTPIMSTPSTLRHVSPTAFEVSIGTASWVKPPTPR